MEISSVIIKPKLTEKTQLMRGFKNPKMAFVVNSKANKYQIANAFFSMFETKPKSVNVLKRKPAKARYMNKNRKNYHKGFKIAFITVNADDFAQLQDKVMKEMNKAKEESETIVETEETNKEGDGN
ncbi:50S ribosomal protein L23 [Candidatus Mycoplasma haematohominis]|uniref:50S ribosomal protein L23 n=1 Tax=Candidatus Mycoplasma haematohominis TaxID=1494318 RepID=UPI001C0A7237|nr:50S ribosomal protein L23 [Candidatus Mycoplasma haemohominis]